MSHAFLQHLIDVWNLFSFSFLPNDFLFTIFSDVFFLSFSCFLSLFLSFPFFLSFFLFLFLPLFFPFTALSFFLYFSLFFIFCFFLSFFSISSLLPFWKNKIGILISCSHVSTTELLHHLDSNKTLEAKAR